MTNQEILDYLNQYRNAGNHIHREAMDAAIGAHEKQIPKKPVNEEGKMWVCPNCYNNLLWVWKVYPTEKTDLKEGLPFCLSCGQAIDWSDNNG